jgi:acyl-coenzyme A thioesterase PaaI-like protein
MTQRAFQDEVSGNHCWGCGSANDNGLQIKSYWSGDEVVCTWQPQAHHSAGPGHILNGGIIATVIDCHCGWTAIAAAYREEGREINTEPLIRYATASLNVKYLRPTPLDEAVVLRARVKESIGTKTILMCSLFAKGEECAVPFMTFYEFIKDRKEEK